jgi:hypothetical protein
MYRSPVVGTGLWKGFQTRAPKHGWSDGRAAGAQSHEIPAAEIAGLQLDTPSAPSRWIVPSPPCAAADRRRYHAPSYNETVVHVKDASRCVGVIEKLMNANAKHGKQQLLFQGKLQFSLQQSTSPAPPDSVEICLSDSTRYNKLAWHS